MGWGHAPLARIGLLATGGVLLAGQASAGAWTPAPGQSQLILSLSRESGDFGEKWRGDSWTEQGLSSGWAYNLKVETELAENAAYEDRTGYRLGLQKSFAVAARSAVGVQVAFLAGDALDGLACEGEGYEARAMAGTSWDLAGRAAFVNVEGGWKKRGGQCERTLAEISTGIELAPKWRAIGKAWTEQGRGSLTTKVEAGVYRDFKGFSLGLGYRQEVSGEFEERGVMLSLSTRS